MHLCEPETFRMFDHHNARIWHIDADFDYRRRDQHIDLATLEAGHCDFLVVGAHASVEQPEANGVYRLTLKTAGLSRRNSNRLGLATVARPYLVKLRDKLDESVALAERRGNSIILIDVIETSHPLRLNIHIGDDCPIHATAIGKAVAAFLSPKELAALLSDSKLAHYTEHTYTKLRDLKLDLARTHKTGCSFNNEETVAGAFIVGAPIFDSRLSVCGALSVNIPTARCSAARKKQLIASVIAVGKCISMDLDDIGFVR